VLGIKIFRILLADDHALFRAGMKYLLSGLDGHVQVTECINYTDAIKIAKQNKDLSIALVDLSMPGFDNFIGLRRLCRELGDVPVVVVSALGRSLEINQAMACGISGYIPKTLESSIVLNALELVLSGGVYLPPALLEKNKYNENTTFNYGKEAKLTPRQRDVLALVACGYSNKEIANKLKLAEGTVKLHISALLKALGVTSRTKAVVRANALGLTSRVSFEENSLL
jgi:DNA-binding NarL/FixJ family response regulator